MRSICLSLSCCLFVLTVSSGCKPTPTSQSSGSQDGMPIVEEKITLTWWIPFLSEGVTSWNNSPVFQEMERLSNIKIDFKTPSDPGQAGTQYQSMLASGMLPDILMHNWFGYPGGPDQAIEDKVYISLNDLIEEDMPNYKKYLSEPEVRRELLTLGGNFAWISAITQKGVEISPPYCGPIIRKDWLDKLNLDEPETIDDWYNMLKAFKLQLNIKNPLVLPSNGIYWEFPIDRKSVV